MIDLQRLLLYCFIVCLLALPYLFFLIIKLEKDIRYLLSFNAAWYKVGIGLIQDLKSKNAESVVMTWDDGNINFKIILEEEQP